MRQKPDTKWTRDLSGLCDIKKILVIRWSAMGDVALSSAGIEDLYKAFPEAELHFNTLPPWDRLFKNDPRFSDIIALDLRGRSRYRQIGSLLTWLRRVKKARYDLIVDLQCTDRARIMISLLWLVAGQPRYRVGNARRFPYNIAPVALPEPVHALTRIRRALQAAGVRASTTMPVLFPGPEDRRAAQEKLRATGVIGKRYAVFLPGSQAAGYLKRWGAERFSALAKHLAGRGIDDVLLLGGPDEIDECLKISQMGGTRIHNLCGRTELLELIPLCEEAALIVANDTGTAHVIAATGIPMLVICGPTDPNKVLPAGDQVTYLQADIACINCYRKHCSHHSCMVNLTPDTVLAAIEHRKLLG